MAEKKGSQLREWIESIIIAVIIAIVIKAYFFEMIQVEGNSMLPTLQHGERLIVNKIGYRFDRPERGDIIIFKYPGDPSLIFIKRVIAVEGDTVEIKNHKVYVNGKALVEPYVLNETLSDYPLTRIPEGTVFVLGDNRNYSRDSRYPDVGFIPLESIRGEAMVKLWPFPPEKIE